MACRGDEWALLSRGIINRRRRRVLKLCTASPLPSRTHQSPHQPACDHFASSWQLESQLPSERALNSASVIWAWLFMLSRAGPSRPAEPQDSRSEIKSFVSVASWLRGLEVSGAVQEELGSAWQAMVLGTLSDSLFSDSPGQLGIPARSDSPPKPGPQTAQVHTGNLALLLLLLPASQASSEPSLQTLTRDQIETELRSSRRKHLSLWAAV